jgi:hypothetical protein
MRCINGNVPACVHAGRNGIAAGFLLMMSNLSRAGPYSSGLANNNPGAIDPGIPGFVGSAVNPVFVGWATACTQYQPAPDVAPGWDDPSAALGPVTGDNFDIVSLGDLDAQQIASGVEPGQITLSFNGGIRDGPGADFAVFENALGTQNSVFAELAYVEVSSDGTHFARFASISLTSGLVGPYGNVDPTNIHNLAGKHINSYGSSFGTPFDLSELSSDPQVTSGQVNLNGLKFVRLVDIPGNGSFTDSVGHPIYDAWLTTESGGLDLEAIGVTHAWMGGDANLDGVVGPGDLAIVAANWQQAVSPFSQGDFDGNGVVNINDLYIMATHWNGGAAPSLAAFAVPEPASLGVIVSLSSAALLKRRARKSSGRR